MKILGIDPTSKYLSLSILEDENVLYSVHKEIGMKHSAMLLPEIDKALKQTKLSLKDLDALALSIGPGSFTGLRIGVALAKGLSMSTGIKIVTVPTMDAIAYNYEDKGNILIPCLDGRKDKIYSCIYERKEGKLFSLTDYLLVGVDELIDIINGSGISAPIFFGDGVKLYKDKLFETIKDSIFFEDDNWYPIGEVVARLGLEKAKDAKFEDIDQLIPLYLHARDCHVTTKGKNDV